MRGTLGTGASTAACDGYLLAIRGDEFQKPICPNPRVKHKMHLVLLRIYVVANMHLDPTIVGQSGV